MSAAPAAALPTNVCPQCGAQFRCGMENGDRECWCASLPALSQLPAKSDSTAATCLCPACLQLRLAAEAAARTA